MSSRSGGGIISSAKRAEIEKECKLHGVPMEWIEDVLAWLCKYGCVSAPRDEIRKMVAFRDYEEPGCLY